MDYSNSYLVTINNGLAKIQDGTFRLIHLIDINKYETLLTDINNHITEKLPKDSFLYPILKHETNQTLEILETLKPISKLRKPRSINILGTAWKYLAGSPDHDDLEIINNNLMNLNQNNNKQTVINELFNKRLSNITSMTNIILNTIKKNNNIIDEVIIDLQSKIRLIKDELINIKYAIQWAKGNILNTVILSKNEVKIALEKLKEEEMPFNNAEEALEFSKINVLSKEMIIVYMVKIPLTKSETFKKIILRPVKKQNNIVLNIEFEEILKIKNATYGIRKPCEKYNDVSICNRNNLLDLSEDQCIPRLLNSLNSSCSTMSGHNSSTIEEIQTGVILLNNFNGQIEINDAIQQMNGTYVIKFYNSSIRINNRLYRNFESKPFETIPSVLQLTPAENKHINLLSLEVLQELHINNTHRIEFLQNTTLSIGTVAVTIVVALIVISIILLRRKSIKIEYVEKKQEIPSEINSTTLSYNGNIPTFIKLNDLPYF